MPLTSELPNELLYTAFTYLDSVELGRAGRISCRWHVVGSDSHLILQHPQVDGQFKEKIVYDMITKDANDLDYLVSLSTPIFRSLKINKTSWGRIMGAARAVSRYDWSSKYALVLPSPWPDLAACCPLWAPGGGALADWAAWNAAYNAINCASLADYLHMWRNCDFVVRGKKAYQIAECLMLLSVNQKLCREIRGAEDIPECEIPKAKLDELHDNPLIKQYIELFAEPLYLSPSNAPHGGAAPLQMHR